MLLKVQTILNQLIAYCLFYKPLLLFLCNVYAYTFIIENKDKKLIDLKITDPFLTKKDIKACEELLRERGKK